MITVEIPPGPMVMGIATGTTAMALAFFWICCTTPSSLSPPIFCLAGLSLPFIMEIAMSKTKIPPPTWKEPTLMPKIFNNIPPVKVKTAMTMKTASAAVRAMRRFSLVL